MRKQGGVHRTVTAEELVCQPCGSDKIRIGVETRRELDYIIPGSIFVREYVRPIYACPRECEGQVVVARNPSSPIEKGLPGAGLLAHVAVSKYSDHLPLNRLEGILSRHGVDMGQQDVDCCRTALMSYLGNIRHPNYKSSDLLLPKTEIIYNLAGEVYPTHQAWRESNFAEWENGRPHRTPWKQTAIKCGDPDLDAETLAFWENDTWAQDLLRNACDTSWSRLSLNEPENLVEMDTHPEFGLTVRTPMTHLIAVHEQVMKGMELVQKTAFGDSRFLEVKHRIYLLPVPKGSEFYDYNEKYLDDMRTLAI